MALTLQMVYFSPNVCESQIFAYKLLLCFSAFVYFSFVSLTSFVGEGTVLFNEFLLLSSSPLANNNMNL